MKNPSVKFLFSFADWRSIAVLWRNTLVYLRNWRTNFIPPAMEPVLFFLAFGVGLGVHVDGMELHGKTIPYVTWVAPGLIAYTAFTTPFYEALYSAYVRMFYQKTWDGILATQVEVRHLIWGEILWAGLRGFMNSSIVCLVIAVFHFMGLIHIRVGLLPLLPPIVFLCGWTFAAFSLIFTALVPAINHMNYPTFLVGMPLGLTSNTYFPLSSDNPALQFLIELNPIYQLAEGARALLIPELPVAPLLHHSAWLALTTLTFLTLFGTIANKLIHKRILT